MTTDEGIPRRLRIVSWVAFALAWLVILGYIALLVVNVGAATPDTPGAEGTLPAVLRALALPGLPPSPVADGLIFVLMCGVFVLALRVSPALLRPSSNTSQALVPELETAHSRSKEALSPHSTDKRDKVTSSVPVRPAPGFVPNVFISHSSYDNAFGLALAEQLAESLERLGTVWYDACGSPDAHCEGLRPGESWWERIQRELTERNVFILILTPEALASQWVKQEIETAHVQAQRPVGKIVVPVFLADPSSLAVPPFLARIQGVNFAPELSYDDAFAELLRTVRLGFTRFKGLEPASERLGPPFILADLPQVDQLVGRDRELDFVLRVLRGASNGQDKVASICAVSGFPGIGKSALAGQAARILRAEGTFPGGIVTISCKRTNDPILLLQQIVAAFDPAGRTPDTSSLSVLARLLTATFTSTHALVILDDVEPQLRVNDVISVLRDAGAAILLTSRQEVLSTQIPPGAHIQLQLLSPDAALEMFALYYLPGESQLPPDTEVQIKRIVKVLGYHTLAVKLAARIARTRALLAYVDELERDPRLAVGLKEGDESVGVVLENSYKSLPDPVQKVFVAFAIFRSSDIGHEAILALATALLGNTSAARDALQMLVNYGLVDILVYEDMPSEGDHERVLLHPLVHTYVSSLFADWQRERQEAAYEAVAYWYINYVADISAASLIYDHENVIGIVEEAHNRQDMSSQFLLCITLSQLWLQTGNIREMISYIPWGIHGAHEIQKGRTEYEYDNDVLGSEATLEMSLGIALWIARRVSEAKAALHRSLQLSKRLEDDEGYGHLIESLVLARLGAITEDQGDSDEAAIFLDDAAQHLHETPDNAFGYEYLSNVILSQIAFSRGDFSNARRYLLQVLPVTRKTHDLADEASILLALSTVAFRANQLDEACGYAEQALLLARENQLTLLEGAALHLMGDIALQRNLLDEAKHYLLQALPLLQQSQAVTQQFKVLLHLCDIARSNGDFETALMRYDQALALDPTSVATWNGKGNVLFDLQRYEDALHAFNQVLVLDPKDAFAWNRKGNTLASLGRYDESLQAYEQALTCEPEDAVMWSNKGFALSSLHRHEEALQSFGQALELDPKNATAWNGKGAALYHLQRYEEALDPFGQALVLDPKFALAWGNKGSTLYHLNRYDQALAAYDRSLALDPSFAFVWAGEGATFSKMRRYDESLQAYDQALALDPSGAITWRGKGDTLHALRRDKEALEAYDQAIAINPHDAIIWNNKGNTLYDLHRNEEALQAYEQALTLDPMDANVWNRKGIALHVLQRYDEAVQAYEQALTLTPQDAVIWDNKGYALYNLDCYEEALQAYEQALTLDPMDANVWNRKGIALHVLQRYDEAVQAYEQALALNPQYSVMWTNKGNTLRALQRYDEALDAYNQALTFSPQDAAIWYNKGMVFHSLHRYLEMLEAYEQALVLDPKLVVAWHGKGDALRHLMRYDEALAAYDHILSLDPEYTTSQAERADVLRHVQRGEEPSC